MADRYRLKLKGLRFISAVDTPAQETATARLVKRKGALSVGGEFRVAKVHESLGLVFGYAFTSTQKGEEYFDLQGDNVLSDDDMIKAALQFVEDGAAADEMHERSQKGTVPFVFPLTAETRAAFEIDGGEDGLMIAMRPDPDTFAKFKSGELVGFSIDGMGEREEVQQDLPLDSEKRYMIDVGRIDVRDPRKIADQIAQKFNAGGSFQVTDNLGTTGNTIELRMVPGETIVVGKRAWLTTSVDGHAHLVDEADFDGTLRAAGSTSWSTSEGDDREHQHAWVLNGDGSVTIGESEGHTHTVVDTTFRPAGAEPAKRNSADTRTEATKMTDEKLTKTIERLERDLAEANQRAALTDAEKSHMATLPKAEVGAWLAKSATLRGEDISKALAADAEVYKTSDGQVFRQSDDPRLVEMAKRADNAERVALAEAQKRAEVELTKRAESEIGNLPGDTSVRVSLLKAVDTIEDAEVRASVLESLKGADEQYAKAFKTNGKTPRTEDTAKSDAQSKFDELVNKRVEGGDLEGVAFNAVLATEKGRELYAAANAEA